MTPPTPIRGRAKPGQPLPPLAKRETRILLLASTFTDVCDAVERDSVRRGKPGSRELRRSTIWRAGSYQDLERLLDELRGGHPLPSLNANMLHLYRGFVARYLGGPFPHGRDVPQKQRDAATHALGWLAGRMPAAIYVPPDFAATWYTQAEALVYATSVERDRWREGAA